VQSHHLSCKGDGSTPEWTFDASERGCAGRRRHDSSFRLDDVLVRGARAEEIVEDLLARILMASVRGDGAIHRMQGTSLFVTVSGSLIRVCLARPL